MMKAAKAIGLAGVLILLLSLTAGGVFRSDDIKVRQQAISGQTNGNMKLLTNLPRMNQMMKVNNVERGYKIKNFLDHQEEIIRIPHNKKDTSHYYDHEAAVDFIHAPSADELEEIMGDINGKVVKHLDSIYIFRSKTLDTPEILNYFTSRPNIEFAEPNFILMQNQVDLPNDLLYQENYQWNLPVIGTEQGWEVTRGNEAIKVAVIDTGIDLDHPDLKNRLITGINVMDDQASPDDDNGHGTHVAGIIASETNNNEGIAGMTWFSKLMPVKAMGAKGYGTTFDIARGIIWAVDHGADIINLSLGNYQPSKVLEEAVQYAYSKNAVMVSAAGNDGSDQPSYPSAYPEVIGVSAVDFDGKRASFSNYGRYIDIAAPGVYIPSTYFDHQYAALSGTSMAAPHVAGLAALIKAANPELTNTQIIKIIKNSAIDLGRQGVDHDFGSGLIDVDSALKEAKNTKPKINQYRGRLFWLFTR